MTTATTKFVKCDLAHSLIELACELLKDSPALQDRCRDLSARVGTFKGTLVQVYELDTGPLFDVSEVLHIRCGMTVDGSISAWHDKVVKVVESATA